MQLIFRHDRILELPFVKGYSTPFCIALAVVIVVQLIPNLALRKSGVSSSKKSARDVKMAYQTRKVDYAMIKKNFAAKMTKFLECSVISEALITKGQPNE